MVLPANAIAEALELSMNELVFDGRAPRSSSSFIFLSAFLTFLALLTTFTAVARGKHDVSPPAAAAPHTPARPHTLPVERQQPGGPRSFPSPASAPRR